MSATASQTGQGLAIPYDSHVHCFPPQVFDALWRWFNEHAWRVAYPYYADEVLGFLDQAGVRRAMVLNYAHKPGMAEWLNGWTRELMTVWPQHLYLGAFHPEDPDPLAQARALLEPEGFSGVKLHSHVQRLAPEDRRLWPLYEVAQASGKIVLFHCGTQPTLAGYGFDTATVSGVDRLGPVLEAFPDLTVVVPHLGAGEFAAMGRMLGAYPNLYTDTAMVLADVLGAPQSRWDVVREHPKKVLFGTDFPNIPFPYGTEGALLAARDPELEASVAGATERFLEDHAPRHQFRTPPT